jgi:DNA-binding SARP family transcriptional activator
MNLGIRLLGTLEAYLDEQPVDLGGPRQRAVLALLLVARGAAVSVDRLIDDLWQGEAPQRATASLQVYVSNLRRALEPDRPPRSPARVLVSAPPGYAVRLDDGAVDTWRFEQLVRHAGDASAPSAAIAALEEALALWRGAAFAEFAAEPWAAPEASRLDELRWVARERLVDARIRAGRSAEAAVEAEALVRDAPLREEGWRLLALGQYAAGRQADSLATLRKARRTLSDELGIDPGPRLVELERDVLAQSVVLAPAPAAAPVVAAPEPAVALDVAGPADPDAGFVGRTDERSALLAAARATRPGAPSAALLVGEAGGGKSALLSQLRSDLLAEGWRVAVGRCPEDDGGPPARAWLESLRSLAAETGAHDLPGLLASFLSDDWQSVVPSNVLVERFRLHRAVHDWLCTLSDRPLAVLIDDVHRADHETRAMLAGLLDQGLAPRVLFVLAYRPEPVEGLEELLATVARYAPTRIRLAGLAPDEAAQLIASLTGTAPLPSVVHALTARTDGNPFYLTESARLLASEGEVVATSQVPEGVADVLRRRLARLPAETVSVLRLASVIGRDVDISLLVRAAEIDEEAVLDALEAGVIAGMLVEPTPGAVRFSHLLVRETLYAGVPNLRRARWHARVVDAAAELHPGDLTAIAYHAARAATPETAAQAAERCVAAAELAESRFAYDSAAEFYLEAERCLAMLPNRDVAAVVDVMTRRVPALMRAGATTRAAETRREAAFLAAGTDDTTLLARAVNCGTVPAMRGNLRPYGVTDYEFIALIERVLADPGVAPDRRCLALSTFVRETSQIGDPRTEPAYLEARGLAYRLGDPNLIGMALWAGGEVYLPDLHPDQRTEIAEEIQRLGDQYDLPVYQVLGHVVAVNSATHRLDVESAQWHAERASVLSRKFQLRQGNFIAKVLTAMIRHMSGDPEGAAAMYQAEFDEQRGLGSVDADAALLLALTTVRYTQGRLGELVEDLRTVYEEVMPAVGHLLALALAETGDLDGARRLLDEVPPLDPDYMWQLLTTMHALIVARVGDRERAQGLYEALLPFADQVAGGATNGFVLTPVGRALGQLALLLGRPDDARRHFERAIAVAETCGSEVWAEQARSDLATMAAIPPR